jgi:hypothetical protein
MRKITPITVAKILISFCLFIAHSSYAQKSLLGNPKANPKTQFIRCGTTEYEKMLQAKNPKRITSVQFEDWLAPIIAKQKIKNLTSRTVMPTYTIPVVIHVIHDGDAINTSSPDKSENISDAQAISQITVLNQDFRKMTGTPGYGTTGYQLGVDCQINFVLAKQDPYGVLTNGIDHVNLGKAEWSEEEIEAIVKPQTQWDPTKYLNIWSIKLSNTKLLGYAQFPSNSNLDGLNTIGGESFTDGVVINCGALGTEVENDDSFQLYTNYSKGRTTTHEVGHWLGLRHIWGDGNGDEEKDSPDCSASDYCSDTPKAGWEHYECGVFDTCPLDLGNDMTENYMDYTNDECMNTFTADQKARMGAVMTTSPRRKELTSSPGATPGFTKTLDAALKNILITVSSCGSSFTPSINFENKGTTTLQTATITYTVDNLNPKTFDWNGNLPQNTSGLISLPAIFSTNGTHQFRATITSINSSSTDLTSLYNNASKSFTIQPLNQLSADTPKVTLILQCDRDGSETTWELKNSSGTTLYNGGPYPDTLDETQLNDPIIQTFDLSNGDCYTFTINDSFGDGINTNGGLGNYSLKDSNNVTFASGGTFIFNESKSFTTNSLGNSAFETSNAIFLYPNPVKGKLTIKIPAHFGLPNKYAICTSLGQMISEKIISKEEDLSVNTSSLSNGIYFIVVTKGTEKKTMQFIKE